MMKRFLGTSLTACLLAGSFLCLGMGMDMGAVASAADHDCCPVQAPADDPGLTCCLLLPAAAASTVDLPSTGDWTALLPVLPAVPLSAERTGPVLETGPPGAASPGFAVPAAPRAPPVA